MPGHPAASLTPSCLWGPIVFTQQYSSVGWTSSSFSMKWKNKSKQHPLTFHCEKNNWWVHMKTFCELFLCLWTESTRWHTEHILSTCSACSSQMKRSGIIRCRLTWPGAAYFIWTFLHVPVYIPQAIFSLLSHCLMLCYLMQHTSMCQQHGHAFQRWYFFPFLAWSRTSLSVCHVAVKFA